MTAARWKAMPWILGISLLAFSFVAANRLLHSQEPNNGAAGTPKKDAKVPAPAPAGQGLTVLGTVDVPLGIARVDAPALPALSGATVVSVFVHEGQEVAIGDPLVSFDDSAFRSKLDQAEAALLAAQSEADKAKAQKDDLPDLIQLQGLAVAKAESDLLYATKVLALATDNFEKLRVATTPINNEAERTQQNRQNPELLKGEGLVEGLKVAVAKEKIDLKRLAAKPVDIDVRLAAAKVKGLTAAVAEAKTFIELTKIKARTAGVVERLTAQPGMTFGPATRDPALYIVPTGARIVRAEIEAEFAHKINDRLGQKVTIRDSHNFSQTYEGKVTLVGKIFLPKRGSGAILAVNPTQVLECVVEVLDPTPAGKPPLRVGQPVRVVFGP